MYRDHYCGEPTEKLVNKEITISGWINKRRDHGGLLFIDLRDRTGLIQVVFDPGNLKPSEINWNQRLRTKGALAPLLKADAIVNSWVDRLA